MGGCILIGAIVGIVLLCSFGLVVNQMVREYYWLQSLGGINSIFDYGDDL